MHVEISAPYPERSRVAFGMLIDKRKTALMDDHFDRACFTASMDLMKCVFQMP